MYIYILFAERIIERVANVCSLDPWKNTNPSHVPVIREYWKRLPVKRRRSVRKQRSNRVAGYDSWRAFYVEGGGVGAFFFLSPFGENGVAGGGPWCNAWESHRGGARGMQGIRDLFLVFACLHFLAICVSENAIDAPTTLSRRKRYLIFPEGSNMQVWNRILYFVEEKFCFV